MSLRKIHALYYAIAALFVLAGSIGAIGAIRALSDHERMIFSAAIAMNLMLAAVFLAIGRICASKFSGVEDV